MQMHRINLDKEAPGSKGDASKLPCGDLLCD